MAIAHSDQLIDHWVRAGKRISPYKTKAYGRAVTSRWKQRATLKPEEIALQFAGKRVTSRWKQRATLIPQSRFQTPIQLQSDAHHSAYKTVSVKVRT